MGNQLLIHLHCVDDDPITNLDIGFLDWLLGTRVGRLRIETDYNGFAGRRFDRYGRIRNRGYGTGYVFCVGSA